MKFFLNFLTYSRILLTPLIIYLIVSDNFLFAGLIFAYCSFSDLADGKIARKYDLVSGHGNYMDPLADKVLMIGTLSALLALDTIQLWPYKIIIGRDGKVAETFSSITKPSSKKFLKVIEKLI